ncbi:AAA family ATPase [Candidatus Sulfurimonas baltica]|uniref:AAA family ATPase n=1 Tax=Candidatus Sulfurimonas baltica TaxID=2740404 RepID=A0A7S7LVN4_9BACT|nr:AAA family ATPase [Candidatus Sulfurimonas baltica]QOY52306.1 AAA family ATPase [Candidatus Sulfurimonas baltica]
MSHINNESTVLNSILNDNSLMENIDLTVNDFTVKENKEMFTNMKAQYDEDGYIELKELLVDLDPKYMDDYQDKIESNSVSDITRYVHRMKEITKKQAIEKALKKYSTIDKDINSSQVIEELGSLVSELEKESNEGTFSLDIQNLSDVIIEQPAFYLTDFLPLQKNEINLISAGGGVGKSYLGILLLSKLKKEYEGINIFSWFSEDTAGFVKNRGIELKAIYNNEIDINFDLAGKGHAMGFVDKGRNGNLQASKFFEFFKKQLVSYDVILLDPLIQFMGNIDENNNGEVRYFFNLLNTWAEEESKTFIIIHHHNKGSNDANGNKTTSVRGASAIIDAVRVHYSISAIDPRIKPIKDSKGKAVKVEQKMSKIYRYCKVEKANHFDPGDGVFEIKIFAPKSEDNQPIVSKELVAPVEVNNNTAVYDCDEIPF